MSQRILVIDDDRSILDLVCELLSDVGYDVNGTVDAIEGLRIVREEQPDLVVLDMRMPIMNGWQFKQALVDDRIEVPIVVMTAAQNARQWASEVEAIGYVAKPFDIDALLDVIEESLPESSNGAEDAGTTRFSLLERLSMQLPSLRGPRRALWFGFGSSPAA